MIFICHILFILSLPTISEATSSTIQSQIDAAKEGDTIEIQAGLYEENITIDKAVQIFGQGDVSIIGVDDAPVIKISASNSSITDLHIQQDSTAKDIPALSITGHENNIQHITIETRHGFGVSLDHAHKNKLKNNTIHGDEQTPMVERHHGIDIWKSNDNQITKTRITDVLDGVYVEKSMNNKLHTNKVTNSRYGYHLMFTKETELLENESTQNVSGLYIMGADTPTVKYNKLYNNQQSNQSLGLLLFDTVNATIHDNQIINNRIGVLIESAKNNQLTHNEMQGNYIGVQFIDAEENEITNNRFIANVVQGQAENSANNSISSNYWGDHVGLDITGDGHSDLPYEMNPFFLNITDTYPPFQLLFQAPGLIFLEQLISIDAKEQLVDDRPLLQASSTKSNMNYNQTTLVLFVSILAFIMSILIIYLGVKKQ